MVQIAALVLPDVFLASLAPLLDAFRLTQERGARIIGNKGDEAPEMRLTLLSPDGRDIAIGAGGKLRVDGKPGDAHRFNFIWIPAFRATGETEMRQRLNDNRAVIDWLGSAAQDGALVGASGAAVALPLAARLDAGLPVPVAAPLLPLMRGLFPHFRHRADLTVVDYERLLLSRGIGQDIPAIVAAFARIFSPATGRWIRSVFGSDADNDGHHLAAEPLDQLVARAQIALEQHFSDAVSIADLATKLGVSHATLIRRFRQALGTTPSGYLGKLRLEAAQRMLLRTDRPIDSIASAVGYADARLMRQMFRKATGMNATDWRRARRAQSAA